MITPCIHFNGNCDEAIAFYKKAFAAEVKEIFYAKDAPDINTRQGDRFTVLGSFSMTLSLYLLKMAYSVGLTTL